MNNLTKYNPGEGSSLSRFHSFHSAFDDILSSFLDEVWRDPLFLTERNWRHTDIQETKDNYVLEVELPRFTKEQIKLETKGNRLKVSAKNDKSIYNREFGLEGADLSKIDAVLENGVLKITLPKFEDAKVKRVEIKTK